MATLHHITSNIKGTVEEARLHGRKYLVANGNLIVPGVLNGSRGPLYYPPEEVGKDPSLWNGMPLVLYHPVRNGEAVSARDPDILEAQQIGFVFRTRFKNKLQARLYFDEALTANHDRRLPEEHRIIPRLRAGTPIETSTGLFTQDEPVQNANHNGIAYNAIARNHKPDHLAVLPDQVGACSVKDGCGVMVMHAEGKKKQPSSKLDISPDKACQILKDGTAQGHPLTKAQRGMFGAKCGQRKKAKHNAFCPTGKGGGRDNSCSSSGGGGTQGEFNFDKSQALREPREARTKPDVDRTTPEYMGQEEHLEERGHASEESTASLQASAAASLKYPGLDANKAYESAQMAAVMSDQAMELVHKGTPKEQEHTGDTPASEAHNKASYYHYEAATHHTSAQLMHKGAAGQAARDAHAEAARRHRLAGDMHRKVSTDMVYNAFCPTGEGGGRDNSCGKGDMSGAVKRGGVSLSDATDAIKTLHDASSHPDISYDDIRGVLGKVTAGMSGSDLKELVASVGYKSKPKNREQALKMLTDKLVGTKGSFERAMMASEGDEKISDLIRKRAESNTATMAALPKAKSVVAKYLKANAFCPTGEGGGRDNTCGHGDTSGATNPLAALLAKRPAQVFEAKIRTLASTDSRSKKALALSNKASTTEGGHEKAAEAHIEAAKFHSTMGRAELAQAHRNFANYHYGKIQPAGNSLKHNNADCGCEDCKSARMKRRKKKARMARKAAAYNAAGLITNQANDTGVDVNKAQKVQWLTTNCDCWKNSKATLETMDEATLDSLIKREQDDKALKANMAKPVTVNGQMFVFNSAGELVPAAPPPAPVQNSAPKQKTTQEWLAEMPPEFKPAWNSIVATHNDQKISLVNNLLTRLPEGEREAERAELMKLEVEDLKRMTRYAGTNNQAPADILMPSYAGAGGAPTHNAGSDDIPVLNLRSIDDWGQPEDTKKKTA